MIEILTILIALILVGILAKLQMRFSVPSPKVRLFDTLWRGVGKRPHPCHQKDTESSTHTFTMRGLLTR